SPTTSTRCALRASPSSTSPRVPSRPASPIGTSSSPPTTRAWSAGRAARAVSTALIPTPRPSRYACASCATRSPRSSTASRPSRPTGRTSRPARQRESRPQRTRSARARAILDGVLRGSGVRSLFVVEVEPSQVPFVVPIESHTRKVGAAFVKELAAQAGGDFAEDPPDIGLMDDFSVLRGPEFDPDRVDPLIREFYEHTTRFTLDVEPRWRAIYKPAFWLFRRLFAEEVGQFNLPFDVREARQGVESHIDTIDFDHDKTIDLRGWVRVYRQSRIPIYVGIYTTRRLDGRGYV